MKVLIIGAEGQVGSYLLKAFSPQHQVSGTSLAGAAGLPSLNMCRAADVDRTVDELRPDYVALAAAMTHVDLCEEKPLEAEAINIQGTANVAAACRRTGAGMAFFSTDYVFDGTEGPYREEDAPNPQSVYARTKWQGERLVLETVPRALVIRTMFVFSYLPGNPNFYMQVWERAQRREPITAPGDQMGHPTHALNLSQCLAELIEDGRTGIVHLAGQTWLSKADFARAIVEKSGGDPALVRSVTTPELKQKAARPLRSGLATDKAKSLLRRHKLWDLDAALDVCRQQAVAATVG